MSSGLRLQAWNHCTTIGADRALSLRFFASFAAKTSHPPKLRHSQKRKQQTAPQVARQDAAPTAKTQISAPCSDERPWCQTPSCKRWWGTGWFLTGFAGLTGLRVATGGTRKTRKSRGERGGETGNSDWWQGYANAPPRSWRQLLGRTCCDDSGFHL